MIYNIDEFRTSCLHHETEERCDNLYAPAKKRKKKKKDEIKNDNEDVKAEFIITKQKIHSMLTFKMPNNLYGMINRDKNSVNNMRKLVKGYLEDHIRLKRYRRNVIIDNKTNRCRATLE